MRKSSWIGAGFFAMGIAYLTFVYFPGNGSDSDLKELYEFSSNGLELTVVTSGEEFTKGEEVSVEATLKNEVGAPVTYDEYCGDAISITVDAEEIDHQLVSKPPVTSCKEKEPITERMISNEQITKSMQFELKIPVNEQETTLSPSGPYTINITFYPTAQPEYTVEIPIVIEQQNEQLVNVDKAKQVAKQSYEAKTWLQKYEDSEQYIVSEGLPFLENDKWTFTWNAMNADQSNDIPDKELIITERAFVE